MNWLQILLDILGGVNHRDLVKAKIQDKSQHLAAEYKDTLEKKGYKFFSGKNEYMCKDKTIAAYDKAFYNAVKNEDFILALNIIKEFKVEANIL